MKKVITILTLILIVVFLGVALTACNMSPIGNYKFNKIHIIYDDYEECLDIRSWTDSEMGIEVNTVKYGSLFVSEGHYLLCESNCPICANKK